MNLVSKILNFMGMWILKKNKVYIIDPKTGRSVYDLPVFDDYRGINAIKYTVDSLKEDEHTLEAFELKRHT